VFWGSLLPCDRALGSCRAAVFSRVFWPHWRPYSALGGRIMSRMFSRPVKATSDSFAWRLLVQNTLVASAGALVPSLNFNRRETPLPALYPVFASGGPFSQRRPKSRRYPLVSLHWPFLSARQLVECAVCVPVIPEVSAVLSRSPSGPLRSPIGVCHSAGLGSWLHNYACSYVPYRPPSNSSPRHF